MRRLFIVGLIFISFTRIIYGQGSIKNDYQICNEIINQKLKLYYEKDLIKNYFKLNKELSYSYYIDFESQKHYKLNYNTSDSINTMPYEYVLWYDVIDKKDGAIANFRMSCYYKDKLLRLERFYDLDRYLEPYIKVIEGKVINLDKALSIAKEEGYNITEWEINYEKKNASNDYKWFFPRLVWVLKEQLPEDKGGKKVIQLNARNGKIIKQYNEYDL